MDIQDLITQWVSPSPSAEPLARRWVLPGLGPGEARKKISVVPGTGITQTVFSCPNNKKQTKPCVFGKFKNALYITH